MANNKYYRRPSSVLAIQFTGDNIEEIWEFFGKKGIEIPAGENPDHLLVTNQRGKPNRVYSGDWVVKARRAYSFAAYTNDLFIETFYAAKDEAHNVCSYCLADPNRTGFSSNPNHRCPECGSNYSGPRREKEYVALVDANLVGE